MRSNLTEVDVFWVATPCNVAVGYQRFEGSCCLHFLPPFSAWRSIEALVSFRNTSWRHYTGDLDFNFHRREDLKSRNL